MATYREGRPRTSVAWDHFQIEDKERGIASCNHCQQTFSFRTSVSNLMKHLKGKHGYVVVRGDEDIDSTDTDAEKSESKQKMKSEVWQYYEVKSKETKQATCSICLDELSYEDETNLTDHLNTKHSVEFKTDEKGSDDDDDDKLAAGLQQSESRGGRSKSSIAWEYFEIRDEDRKVAACNLCGALCSYRTSVSNLMKHVKRKHDIGNYKTSDEEENAQDATETDADSVPLIKLESTSMSRAQRSIVWLYFKCIDPVAKLSQCLICKKLLSHSTTLTNLKKHLARKHPNVKIPVKEDGRKRILLSSGGELYEVETESKNGDDDDEVNDFNDTQNDTVEMNTVFLEDFDALTEEKPAKKRRLNKSSSKKKKDYSSSSDEEEITFINRYVKKQNDSFDHFGKYIASLLRKLPKDESARLQADFVRQITSVKVLDEGDLTVL